MIAINVGTSHAIERYRDDEGALQFRALDGNRLITLAVPDEMNAPDALKTTVHAIFLHIQAGERPDWVECSDEVFLEMLKPNLQGVAVGRPSGWQSVIEASESEKPKRTRKKKPEDSEPEASAEEVATEDEPVLIETPDDIHVIGEAG
jgi:hypothetical protein